MQSPYDKTVMSYWGLNKKNMGTNSSVNELLHHVPLWHFQNMLRERVLSELMGVVTL